MEVYACRVACRTLLSMKNYVLSGLLLFITVVWGWTFSVVKDAVAGYGVVPFLAIRFAIGTACLGVLGWRRVNRQSLVAGAWIGMVLALGFLLQTFGLRDTSVSNSGLITSLFVLFAPLANWLLFGTPTPRLLWAAVGLSLVGLVLLTGAGPTPPTRGDWLSLGAAACFGMQIVLVSRFSRNCDTLGLSVAQVASATIVFLIALPVAEPVSWPSGEVWYALLLTGVVATAAGFYIQTLAQRQLPAARAAVIFTLESVFAVFFGYVLAGDRLAGIQIVGALLTIAAVGLGEIGPAVFRQSDQYAS